MNSIHYETIDVEINFRKIGIGMFEFVFSVLLQKIYYPTNNLQLIVKFKLLDDILIGEVKMIHIENNKLCDIIYQSLSYRHYECQSKETMYLIITGATEQ